MLLHSVRVLAVLSVALYLVPTCAHLAALPNKMAMSPADYMVAQQIYRGWNLFGVVVFAAVMFTLAHTIMRRSERATFFLSLAAFLCMVGTQVIFWTLTFPMNAATSNWTVMPADIEGARNQWEYSHAASAVLTIAAVILITCSVAMDDRAARGYPARSSTVSRST